MLSRVAKALAPAIDYREAAAELAKALRSTRVSDERIDVLEAGGGLLTHVLLPPSARITVIDVSQEQLDRNSYAHTKVLADLHTHEFAPSSFDVIVCWNVLEHLKRPDRVIHGNYQDSCRVKFRRRVLLCDRPPGSV